MNAPLRAASPPADLMQLARALARVAFEDDAARRAGANRREEPRR